MEIVTKKAPTQVWIVYSDNYKSGVYLSLEDALKGRWENERVAGPYLLVETPAWQQAAGPSSAGWPEFKALTVTVQEREVRDE